MKLNFRWNPFRAREAIVNAAYETMRETAMYMGARAVDYAPVDTGFLSQHIQVQELGGQLGFRVISTAFYSGYVEFGSLHHGTWIPPNPFMRKALADARQHFPAIASKHKVGTGGTHNPEGFLGTTFTT